MKENDSCVRTGSDMNENDYCIMARLVTGKDNSLRINNSKYIIKEPLPESLINKAYDLHICPNTELYVIGPEGLCTEYTLLLFLMDSSKKIRQISETKVDIAKKVFETLVEEDLDFTCENYTETRNKIFTQSITINEPYIKDPYVGRYTWSPKSNNSTNYVLDPRDVVASTDITAGYNGKSVIDALQEWSKLLDTDKFNKLQETATGDIVTRPRDVLANKIYDSTYEVCYKYDDYTDNKG
jgi:hypothetical protein